MVYNATPTRIARPGASTDLSGRGRPQLVRATTAVAVVMEAQCFARDVVDACGRIQTMAAMGDRARLVQEAGRLGDKATNYGREFAALAAEIEA